MMRLGLQQTSQLKDHGIRRWVLVLGACAATLLTSATMAYENLASKQRYTEALNCTSSRLVNNANQAHQSLLEAAALDKSKKSLVGPDPNSEKYLAQASLALEANSSANNPNYHCYQTVLSLLSCYHLDNCH